MRARIYSTIAALTMLFAFSVFVSGQDQAPDPEQGEQNQRRRPNLLRELELSPEQMAEITKYNAENRPLIREAQLRLREANKALDGAIYSEKVEDSLVDQKLKEFQEAQAEVARLRFAGELALRKILTLDQLLKFRELRQRFAENRERMQQERRQRPGRERNMRRQNRPGQQVPPGI